MDATERTGPKNPPERVGSKAPLESGTFPRWSVLYVTTLGAFMVALDSNIVTLALPEISKALSAGYSLLGVPTSSVSQSVISSEPSSVMA